MSSHKNRCWILFADTSFSLDSAREALTKTSLSVAQTRNALKVRSGSGPELTVTVSHGGRVADKLTQLPSPAEYSERLTSCTSMITVTFADLAEVLDEINTLVEVQLTLQAVTHGLLFTSWNFRFAATEE